MALPRLNPAARRTRQINVRVTEGGAHLRVPSAPGADPAPDGLGDLLAALAVLGAGQALAKMRGLLGNPCDLDHRNRRERTFPLPKPSCSRRACFSFTDMVNYGEDHRGYLKMKEEGGAEDEGRRQPAIAAGDD